MRSRLVLTVVAGFLMLAGLSAAGQNSESVSAAPDDEQPVDSDDGEVFDNCPVGFTFVRMSGVSCVQDAETLPENGGLSYTGSSICPVGGFAVYEQRETTDGLPAPGAGGKSTFAFLLSCDGPANGSETGVDTADGDEASSNDDSTRKILIGLGGGAAGIAVSVGVARLLMKRWKMTPKQLLMADLSDPLKQTIQIGDQGESGYDENVPGDEGEGGYDEDDGSGNVFDEDGNLVEQPEELDPAKEAQNAVGGVLFNPKTGEWIDYGTGASGSPTITGSGEPSLGPKSDKGLAPPKSRQKAPAQTGKPAPLPGFSFGIDPATSKAGLTYQLNQPGQPLHATVWKTKRDTSLKLGIQPSRQLSLDFSHDTGGSNTTMTWKPNHHQTVTLSHNVGGAGHRTDIKMTVRF
ncbi:MAG: hypothetical protein DRJ50_14970 [Actinobacteria bacterium]|nr:MAG: hypothetical protein DRJ50_14970 [Actinomycetota bacterium]